MSEDKNFESILISKFRFPRVGDKPFIESADYSQNADISLFKQLRFYSMALGYKDGADLMVDRALNDDKSSIDLLVYPLIFCYRHYIELSLKQLIKLCRIGERERSIWNTHNLSNLWEMVKDLINEYGIEDVNDSTCAVTKIIENFGELDQGSYSFRYPVDNRGQPIELEIDMIDLKNLADVMDGFQNYIEVLNAKFTCLVSDSTETGSE